MTMHKERSVIFTGHDVLATLKGWKTQFRQIMKPQPPNDPRIGIVNAGYCGRPDLWLCNGDVAKCRDAIGVSTWRCPFGRVGDRLWVKERWRVASCYNNKSGAELEGILSLRNVQYEVVADKFLHRKAAGRLRSPVCMPRWASRITLEITDVRVERLRSISLEDCAAEGAPLTHLNDNGWDSVDMFREHWKIVHGSNSWDENPWVWVLSFKVIHPTNLIGN